MAKRVMKYNPAFLTEGELVRSFVVRQGDFERLLEIIRENTGESNQHILVVGPRGIGKTTLALRIAAELRTDEELRKQWFPLIFGEESYAVTTPGEFWLEAIFHLGLASDDPRWQQTHAELSAERDEDRLRERALAQLLDFADTSGKRLMLVVENFNTLLAGSLSDDDAWVLRHTLQTEPRIMLLATATSRFEEVESVGKAMFNLFKLHELHPLDEVECRTMWTSLTLKESMPGRIRPIQILTGGNPRLIAIISSFAAMMSLRELMDDLLHLLDEHTEYFKSHLENLPTIERKVFLALAGLWSESTARAVADAARLEVSKTSALLQRLVGRGMVTSGDGDGRAKHYQVAERMYNIYYLMRRSGGQTGRVRCLVNFMVALYEPEQFAQAARQIAMEACSLDPDLREDHYRVYAEMLDNATTATLRSEILRATPDDFFKAPDAPTSIANCVSGTEEASAATVEHRDHNQQEVQRLLELGDSTCEDPSKAVESERAYRAAIKIAPKNPAALARLALLLFEVERWEDAVVAARKLIKLDPEVGANWGLLGTLLWCQDNYLEAESVLQKAVGLDASFASSWASLGVVSDSLEDYEAAEVAYRKALGLAPEEPSIWAALGLLLHGRLERYDEAEEAYRKAIALDESDDSTWNKLGELLSDHMGRHEEAEAAYRRAIELDDKNTLALMNLGELLTDQFKRYEEAEGVYRTVVEQVPDEPWAWGKLGQLLHDHSDRYEEAEKAYRKAIELAPDNPWPSCQLGNLLELELDRFREADAAYLRAVELHSEDAIPWFLLGRNLYNGLGRHKDAAAAFRKAIELDFEFTDTILEVFISADKLADGVNLLAKCAEEHSDESHVLDSVAWSLYLREQSEFLPLAEQCSRKALAAYPDNAKYHHTLASILSAQGKGTEALDHVPAYLVDPELVKENIEAAIRLFVSLAATGHVEASLKVLTSSPSAGILEPLIIGMRLFAGHDVKAAAEMLEVGKDVADQIRKKSEQPAQSP